MYYIPHGTQFIILNQNNTGREGYCHTERLLLRRPRLLKASRRGRAVVAAGGRLVDTGTTAQRRLQQWRLSLTTEMFGPLMMFHSM